MATAAGKAHVDIGAAVFWDQEDPYVDEGWETYRCPVCHGTSLSPGCCCADCHAVWTYNPPPDPYEFDRFF